MGKLKLFLLSCLVMAGSLPMAFAQSTMSLGTNFWNIGWGIRDGVFKSGVNWSTTTDPWNAQLISELGIYKAIRPMDFVPTNNTTITSWSQRIPKTADHYTTDGVAYEWQIDLCNRMNAHFWTTIPHAANDDYIRQLATLVKSNLKPGLKVYVEYSNETWNWGFQQAKYCAEQGAALGLPGDYYQRANHYQAIAAIKCWRIFQDVFGSEMSSRVVKVLAGQDGNEWLAGVHFSTIESTTWNPTGIRPDVYAVGPYIGHDVRGDDPAAIQKLIDLIPGSVAQNQKLKDYLTPKGVGFVAYEGGQHIANYSTPGGNGSNIANRDPRMYEFYSRFLNAYKNMFSLFMHYCHSGAFSGQGSWGAVEYVGQPLSQAHKYRALVDFAKGTSPADSQAPTAPANLTSPAKTAATVNLSWSASTDNVGVTGYEIYRGTTLAGTSAGTSYQVTGLSASTTYSFTVKAYDAAGNRSASSTALGVTTSASSGTTHTRITGTAFGTVPWYGCSTCTFDKAFDGNTATYFDANDASGAYTGIDAGTAKTVTRIRFHPRAANAARMTGGKFQGSNTSASAGFVDLHTIATQPAEAWQQVDLTGTTGYRYLRYLGGTNSYGNVAEIEFYTSGSTTTPPPAGFSGTYRITARHSAKALDVANGSTADGANVHQWTANGATSQQWIITATTDGYYKLVGKASGKALEVSNSSLDDRANVQQWTYAGLNTQQWKIEATTDGYHRLINRNSGKALDVAGFSTADGANVQQYTYSGGNNQQWKLELLSTATARLGEVQTAGVMEVYPNPGTDGFVNVKFSSKAKGTASVELTSGVGQRASLQDFAVAAGQNTLRVSTAGLSKGFYLLSLRQGSTRTVRKIYIK